MFSLRTLGIVLVVAALNAVVGGVVSAEPAPSRRVSGTLHLGHVDSPNGWIGASLGVDFRRRVRVSAGVGYNNEGAQLAAMVHALLGPGGALALGVGLSNGAFYRGEVAGVDCDEACDGRRWFNTTWVDAQVSVRHHLDHHWHLTPYAGMSMNLEPEGHDECASNPGGDGCNVDDDGSGRIFLGVSIGRVF